MIIESAGIIGVIATMLSVWLADKVEPKIYYILMCLGCAGFLLSCYDYWNPYSFTINLILAAIGLYKLWGYEK